MDVVPVYGAAGKKVGTVQLREGVFGSALKESLVHRAVVMQRASSRQGNASTKGRGEVRGSGKNPGSRSILVEREPGLLGHLFGGMVGQFLVQSQGLMVLICLKRLIVPLCDLP